MKPIPLHRTATVFPFINYLQHLGAPVERELHQAGLPIMALNQPNYFVPSLNYWNFVAKIAAREDIEDLGFLVGCRSGANAADPELTEQLVRLPTLRHALALFCDLATTEISRVVFWLETLDNSHHRLCYRPSFGSDHPAYAQLQWYGLTAAMGVIHLFTGNRWRPDRIGLGSSISPSSTIREYFPNTVFSYEHGHCYLAVTNRELGKPAGIDTKPSHFSTKSTVDKPADDFVGSLKQSLQGYLLDGAPNIDHTAGLTGNSVRSLQRQLAKQGLSYRDLLNQVRMEKATGLLRRSDETITEIAHVLGYSDPSHFARAFKRSTGFSPRAYTRLCQKQQV